MGLNFIVFKIVFIIAIITMIIFFIKFFLSKEFNLSAKLIIMVIFISLSGLYILLDDYYINKGYTGIMESKHKIGELIFFISIPSYILTYIGYRIYIYRLSKSIDNDDDIDV